MLGFRLPPYHTSIRKQQRKSPKFYLFDTGIARTLAGQVDYDLVPRSFEYGQLFEAFVINEFYRRLTYQDKQFKLSYLRVNEDMEIDLIIERGSNSLVLVEIKSANRINEHHAKALITLGPSFKSSKRYLISNDPNIRSYSGVLACPWNQAIDQIMAED